MTECELCGKSANSARLYERKLKIGGIEMTDEEMAMKKATEKYPIPIRWKGIDLARNSCYEQGFLSGLKAGKDMNVPTKWHDLRKNPNDLPPLEKGAVVDATIDVLTDRGEIAYYYYDGDESCWCDTNANEIDMPKAWCEIPKFEEESK